MATQSLPQSASSRNPQQVPFVPVGDLPANILPGLVNLPDGQVIHAPVWDPSEGRLIVDTGSQVVELDLDEMVVMQAVVTGWFASPLAQAL